MLAGSEMYDRCTNDTLLIRTPPNVCRRSSRARYSIKLSVRCASSLLSSRHFLHQNIPKASLWFVSSSFSPKQAKCRTMSCLCAGNVKSTVHNWNVSVCVSKSKSSLCVYMGLCSRQSLLLKDLLEMIFCIAVPKF